MRFSDLVDIGLEVSTADGTAHGGALAALGAVVVGAAAVAAAYPARRELPLWLTAPEDGGPSVETYNREEKANRWREEEERRQSGVTKLAEMLQHPDHAWTLIGMIEREPVVAGTTDVAWAARKRHGGAG